MTEVTSSHHNNWRSSFKIKPFFLQAVWKTLKMIRWYSFSFKLKVVLLYNLPHTDKFGEVSSFQGRSFKKLRRISSKTMSKFPSNLTRKLPKQIGWKWWNTMKERGWDDQDAGSPPPALLLQKRISVSKPNDQNYVLLFFSTNYIFNECQNLITILFRIVCCF